MDDSLYRRFFVEPSSPPQRQYEALRAVFVDGLPQTQVAARFGYSYDALRQLIRQFRQALDAGQPPLFSTRTPPGHPQGRSPNRSPADPTSPTSAP